MQVRPCRSLSQVYFLFFLKSFCQTFVLVLKYMSIHLRNLQNEARKPNTGHGLQVPMLE